MKAPGYIELVGGIPRRRQRPNVMGEAFALGYLTAQLHTERARFLEEQQRAAQEIGATLGSILPLLLAMSAGGAAVGGAPVPAGGAQGGGLMGLLNVLPPPPPSPYEVMTGQAPTGGLPFVPPPGIAPPTPAPGSGEQMNEQGAT